MVDEDFDLVGFVWLRGLPQADDFHSGVVELEVLDQVIPDHLRTGLGQHPILVRIADSDRCGNNGQAELILFQEFPGLIETLFIFEFCIVGFVKNILGVVGKFLAAGLRRQLRNPVLLEFGRILVTALFEEATEQKISVSAHPHLQRRKQPPSCSGS